MFEHSRTRRITSEGEEWVNEIATDAQVVTFEDGSKVAMVSQISMYESDWDRRAPTFYLWTKQ